jgi:hypothetical protein
LRDSCWMSRMRTLCLFAWSPWSIKPSETASIWVFSVVSWEGVLEGWLSIPLDLASFCGPNHSYGMPMRYS